MNAPADPIDITCRRPVKLLLAGAGFWILVGAVLTLFASIELHVPRFSSPIWNYGKLQAAQESALLYGFGMQSVLALSLWMLSRLSGKSLTGGGLATVAGLFWNLGLGIGVAGILLGDSTGFEGFQLPSYAVPILLVSFFVIAFFAAKAFWRNSRSYGVSEWFLVAALLWFGWICLNGTLFLSLAPARGVVQACIALWYAESLRTVIFGFAGLATAFYFIPQILGVPLHSRQLALFALWGLALFGTCAGVPNGAPLPAWIVSASTVSTILLILPVVAVVLNLFRTVRHNLKQIDSNPGLRFICAGLVFWVVGMAQTVVGAIPAVNSLTSFTLFTAARIELLYWGFFALTVFGGIHLMLPRVVARDWPWAKLTGVHFWGVLLGMFIVYMAELVGGIGQGVMLNDPDIPFATVMKTTLLPLRVSTVGYLLIAIGVLAFVINLWGMVVRGGGNHVEAVSRPSEGCSGFPALPFLGLGATLILPWVAFVAGPLVQLGGLEQEKVTGSEATLYPQKRPGLAIEGAQVYRANGCAACHTQQVRPAGMGSDLARGWGRRRSVARDYLFDNPPLLGSQRIGPDLTDIGLRQNADTLLLHLYNPKITEPKSIMPSYRFLFETKKVGEQPSPDALKIAGNVASGMEIVPRSQAKALVAYLQSLRSEKALYETPVPTVSVQKPASQPKGGTNSP